MAYRRSWTRDFERSVRDNPEWPVLVSGGDSWFSYPEEPNVIDLLDDPTGEGRQRDWSLLRLENGSDELTTALSAGHRGELRAVLDKTLDELNAELPSYSTIKKFAVLPGELSVEAGELTPSLKIKRRAIEKKYRDLLDGMYPKGE